MITSVQVFYRPNQVEEALLLRDSLAKAVYLALFTWAVEQINLGTSGDIYQSVIGVCCFPVF